MTDCPADIKELKVTTPQGGQVSGQKVSLTDF